MIFFVKVHVQVHIGKFDYAVSKKNFQVGPAPLWRTEFNSFPLVEGPGRFFNQCIQKKCKTDKNCHFMWLSGISIKLSITKGLTDFTDGMLVAVIGGCEGSAVLAVVELNTKVMDGVDGGGQDDMPLDELDIVLSFETVIFKYVTLHFVNF